MCYAGIYKADGTFSLIRSANYTILFDTGLPIDKEFLVAGVKLYYLYVKLLSGQRQNVFMD